MTAGHTPAHSVRVHRRHVVTADLTGLPDLRGLSGTFRPDRVQLKWVNGQLITASVSGVKITARGTLHGGGVRTSEHYSDLTTGELLLTAPQWIRDLADNHGPQAVTQ